MNVFYQIIIAGSEKCDIEMADKLNCWDFKKCCDKSLSHHARESIVCPVKKELTANGLNSGINGGRICWVIMDSHCKKKSDRVCFQCEFRNKVMAEEGLLNNCNATGMYLNSLGNKKFKNINNMG